MRACSGFTITGLFWMQDSMKWIVSGPMPPANTWSTCSPGMVDIGNTWPVFSVLSQLSRWVSSSTSAPSVPVISIQVEQ